MHAAKYISGNRGLIGLLEDKTKFCQMELCLGVENPHARDQCDLMQYPFFSLSKNKRTEPIVYDRSGVRITVRGLADIGIATIWDKDFLIWAASQINEAINQERKVSPRLWVDPPKFFRWIRRVRSGNHMGGADYDSFESMLKRLQGTQVLTDIKADGEKIIEAWSWIDTWRMHKTDSGLVRGVEVVLSEWFLRRVLKDRAVLSIDPEYFSLRGGIQRWLYKIARKHCGNNDSWFFSTKALYEKYPSGREYKKFRADLKRIILADCLPEYRTICDDMRDGVVFVPREGMKEQRRLPRELRDEKK